MFSFSQRPLARPRPRLSCNAISIPAVSFALINSVIIPSDLSPSVKKHLFAYTDWLPISLLQKIREGVPALILIEFRPVWLMRRYASLYFNMFVEECTSASEISVPEGPIDFFLCAHIDLEETQIAAFAPR